MARFILNNDYHFLEFCSAADYNSFSIIVKEMNKDSNGNIYWNHISNNFALLHPRETRSGSNTTYFNELEIYGVVIDGYKLQQLMLELLDRGLTVNRQGLCLVYSSEEGGRNEAYYPLHDLFNWSNYGVTNVPYPPQELWSVIGFPQFDKYKSNSFDNYTFLNTNQSKEIRLDADDLFISCKAGPLLLWKVDSPSTGHIRNVRLMGIIFSMLDMSRLEVNGVTLQGGEVYALCKELRGRQVMVNAHGCCLFYTGDPSSGHGKRERGGFYYRIVPRFEWYKYGVPTSANSFIWGPKDFLGEVEPITELVFPPNANRNERGNERNNSGCEDKPKQTICVGCGARVKEQNTCGCEEKPKQKICVCCGAKLKEQNKCGCEEKPKQKICVCGGVKDEQNTCGCEEKPKQEICECCEAKVKEQNTCGCEKKPKQKICVWGGVKDEQNTSGCETKTTEIICSRCGTKAKEERCETRLKEKEKELCSCRSKLEQKEIELRLCETRLKEKDRELDDYKVQVKEKDLKLCLLEQCLEEKQQELEDCEEKLKKKEKEVCLYKLQLEEKERELGVSEKRLREKGQELVKCKSRLEEKEKELSCYKKLLREKDQELNDCKSELENKKKEFCLYKNRVGDLENKLKECESQKKKIEQELSLCKSQLEKTKKELCQKEKELQDLESELQEKKKELCLCKKQLEEKDQELKKLSRRLRAQQNKVIALQTALDSLVNPEEGDCEPEEKTRL